MREVTLTETGPVRLTEEDMSEKYGDIAVCRCGLSDEFPLCDGSHRATEDEAEGVRYKYVDGERRVVEEVRLAEDDGAGREPDGEKSDGARADPDTSEDDPDPDGSKSP